jgi:hypothetical protein
MSAQAIIRISTAFGDVVLRQFDLKETSKAFSFEVAKQEVSVVVPSGMTIERAVRLDLRLKSQFDGEVPKFCFVLDANETLNGSPSSGEWLDSIAFERMNGSLSLGARDHEWMASVGHSHGMFPLRFSKGRSGSDPRCAYQVSYLPNGLLLNLGKLEAGESIQIPLGLALSEQSLDSLSTWFGVDAVLP